MKRILFALPALALALVAVLGSQGAGTAHAEPTTVKVIAGEGETGYSVNAFLPGKVTIETGSTVEWEFPWYELHIVAGFIGDEPPVEEPAGPVGGDFPNAEGFFYSGEVFGDPDSPPTFSVRFTEAGVYDYFCPIHPLMLGQIEVLDADSPNAGGIDNEFSLAARAEGEYASRIVNIKEYRAQLAAQPVSVTTKANGGKSYGLIVGGIDAFGDDVQQFIPPTINVVEGDSIVWNNDTYTPHNIVFGVPAQADPFEFPGTPTGSTYTGGNLQSPMTIKIPGVPEEEVGLPSKYEVVFGKEGTYSYFCLLHADQGMVGQVVVAKKPTPPTAPLPPNTGTGSATDGGNGLAGIALVLGAVVLAGAASTATVVAARRR